MKNIIIAFVIIAAGLTACNNDKSKTEETTTMEHEHDDSGMAPHQHEHNDTTVEKTAAVVFPLKEIIAGYLQLKNAFTKDNSNDAAAAGTALQTAFKNFDKTALSATQKKTFEDVADDAGEHAEHIGKNGGNIAHQREHFEMLSKDVYDLVKTFGGGQLLYKDFCPMYNNGKGAFWISETKDIKNPYLGKAMPTCGTIKEEIK